MKIRMFTHTDLDGVGCAIVLKTMMKKVYHVITDIDISYHDYDDINSSVMDYVMNTNVDDYDYIYITDISVNEETAQKLDKLVIDERVRVVLIDHHKTALWLNEYEWAHVYSNDESPKSATLLLLDYLISRRGLPIGNTCDRVASYNIRQFATLVSRWDTWLWVDGEHNYIEQSLNRLSGIYDKDTFIWLMADRITYTHPLISNTEYTMLDSMAKQIGLYVKECHEMVTTITNHGLTYGVVFCEKYVNEVAKYIYENHPEFAFVAIVNLHTQSVSLRTNKEEVDVSVFAKKFGGGGHKQASGFKLKCMNVEKMLSNMLGYSVD